MRDVDHIHIREFPILVIPQQNEYLFNCPIFSPKFRNHLIRCANSNSRIINFAVPYISLTQFLIHCIIAVQIIFLLKKTIRLLTNFINLLSYNFLFVCLFCLSLYVPTNFIWFCFQIYPYLYTDRFWHSLIVIYWNATPPTIIVLCHKTTIIHFYLFFF